MTDFVTCANDIVQEVEYEFGFVSVATENNVSVHRKGDSLVHIYCPSDESQDVVNFLKTKNCRITKKCTRSRNNEVVFEVMVGQSKSGGVYSDNFEQEEIYRRNRASASGLNHKTAKIRVKPV